MIKKDVRCLQTLFSYSKPLNSTGTWESSENGTDTGKTETANNFSNRFYTQQPAGGVGAAAFEVSNRPKRNLSTTALHSSTTLSATDNADDDHLFDHEAAADSRLDLNPTHIHHKLPPKLAHLERLLFGGKYDSYHAADWEAGVPANIFISLYIESVSQFKEADMSYDVDLYLRKSWHDYRLKHHAKRHLVVNEPHLISNIWKPDLYFSNAKESNINAVTKPNQMVKIFPDGTVLHSLRIASKISCHLALHHYPVDSQECDLKLLSYSHPVEEMNLHWAREAPLNYNRGILMAAMTLEKIEHNECRETFGNVCLIELQYVIDTFSCLKAAIFVRRQIGAHMVQTYVPSFIIVVISWASFWIDPYAVPARVTLSFTTLLTLTTQAAGVRMNLPTVAYAQALDYWMGMCTLMVFGALLEYTIVNSLLQKAQRAKAKDKKRKSEEPLLNSFLCSDGTATLTSISIDESMIGLQKEKYYIKRAYWVEKISRVAFPSAFFIVNIIYWVYLSTS